MTTCFKQRPGAHVRAADAQDDHPIRFTGQLIGRLDDTVKFFPIWTQEFFRQAEKSGVQGLEFRRHGPAFLEQGDIFQHLPPHALQLRT